MSRVVRKPALCIYENKDADQLAVTAKLISAFVFATRIVQSLFFLNPKFQASSHLLWLYSPFCVGSGRKPRRPVFSERGSNSIAPDENMCSVACNLVVHERHCHTAAYLGLYYLPMSHTMDARLYVLMSILQKYVANSKHLIFSLARNITIKLSIDIRAHERHKF